jgi:hypothetical protein
MKRRWILPLIILCLGGCIANDSLYTMSSSENNAYNLWRISKGMSECDVIRIMHKPFDYETFAFDDDIYDVWFYITRVTGLGQTRMVAQNLTPLTFKNGVLVDVGYVYYNFLLKEEQLREKAAAAPPEKPEEAPDKYEDIELEKTLETAPRNGSAPIQPSPRPKGIPSSPTPVKPGPKTLPAPAKPSTPSKPKTPQPPNPQPDQGTVPQNQLPGRAPTPPPQPNPPKKNNPISMCSRMKSTASHPENEADSEERTHPNENEGSGPKWDSEDDRMQEEESEQNFDYW